MKNLNTLRELLDCIKTSGIHVGLPITKEECLDLQGVIQEYLDRRNLRWDFYYDHADCEQDILLNNSSLEFGEIRKLRPSFMKALNNPKQYFAWRLKPDSVSGTESAYFDTKQEAIDWVVDFYKSNGYTIVSEEQEKC
jgi:hypothetical protein